MTSQFANLEIGLHPWKDGEYAIHLRFAQSNSDTEQRSDPIVVRREAFDRRRFEPLLADEPGYGQLLGETLFGDPRAMALFARSQAAAEALEVPLRIRLALSPMLPNLHDLRWELLRHPETGAPLFLGDNVLFSRYLNSADPRPVRIRAESRLRVLVVVASPDDLADWDLDPIDVGAEHERVERALPDADIRYLKSTEAATLENVVDALREAEPNGGYDILYLVCHGLFPKPTGGTAARGDSAPAGLSATDLYGEPRLWLENERGGSHLVNGQALGAHLVDVAARPRMVILVSCESAGTGDDARRRAEGALTALGPRLAMSGIPAVVAMQGKISFETMDGFLPVFFETLEEDGRIDLAVSRARGAVRHRSDYWMPVLFMRLTSGRLWWTGVGKPFEGWPALLNQIRNKQCTPL
ncbi:MAG: CHAT domain-containing protein, partial [Planctomycetes bacterium]|nr:CHAT domain-containing protein [Planctomycetota bacterium]